MAELARWQWDDIGTWRDFAEQYQAEMEAAFQCRDRHVELAIPPFGVFKMDLQRMTQTTIEGRNVGYSRPIRRQVRKIELGYFLLGYEGEIFASDDAVDNIKELAVLEALAQVLQRIVDDPEEFSHRSINLTDEFQETLGKDEQAQQFLSERGFESIEEGSTHFLIFMQEQVGGLADACREVEASLARLKKQQGNCSKDSNPSMAMPSNNLLSNEAPSNNLSNVRLPSNYAFSNLVPSNNQPALEPDKVASEADLDGSELIPIYGRGQLLSEDFSLRESPAPSSCEMLVVLPSGKQETIKLSVEAGLDELLIAVKDMVPGLRLPLLRQPDDEVEVQADVSPLTSDQPSQTPQTQSKNSKKDKGKGKATRKAGKGNKGYKAANIEQNAIEQNAIEQNANPKVEDVLDGSKPCSRKRAPLKALALCAEPGMTLLKACPERLILLDSTGQASTSSSTAPRPAVVVEDFEEAFQGVCKAA